jgi:hypothetical protein
MIKAMEGDDMPLNKNTAVIHYVLIRVLLGGCGDPIRNDMMNYSNKSEAHNVVNILKSLPMVS